MLPLLNLQHLRAATEPDRKTIARSEAGTVIHEAGHFLAAAKSGLPMDFLLFNWSSTPPRIHAAYLHPRYNEELKANSSARLGLLAAGYAAEILVLQVGLLNRAFSDLEAAAGLLGFDIFDLERDGRHVAAALQKHNPFSADDAAVLVDMHNELATMINAEGGPDDIFVVPNYRIPRRFSRSVPFLRRVRSARASRSMQYALAARDRLLSGDVRSGV